MTRPFVWPLTNSCAGGAKPPGSGKGASRRGLLEAAGVLLAGSGAVAAAPSLPHPDAALLAACAEFERLDGEYSFFARLPAGDPRVDAGVEALGDQQEPLVDLICTTPALTAEGFRAKTWCLISMQMDRDPFDDPGGYWDHRLVNSLARDLKGGAA